MNAGGSPAAVAHSSCLSSSICSAAARQASASNVGLPYSPGGCVLSLSSAVVTPSFFRIPRRHRSYSTDSVFVVKGSSSAFEVDKDREEHGLQTAEKHVRKGKVSWSYDGKPTILWGSQDEQDKASLSQANRQSSAAKEDMKADKLASKFGSQHEPFKPFVGEHHNNSIALQSQESAFHSIKERPSSPNRQQSELFNPSSASRLLVGLPGFKQAAERDTLAAHNAYSQFQGAARFHEAPNHGEAAPKGGPGLTSKLEEILNNFRTTQKREEVLKDPRSRQKRRDDPFEEGAAAPSDLLNAASKVFRKGSNLNGTHTWKSLRNHIQSSNNGGFVHKTSAEDVDVKQDSIASTEGHRIVRHGERNFTRGQKNTRGSSGDNEPLDSINGSPATPWGVEKGRFSVSQMHGLAKDGSSTFVKRRAAKSESLQYNSRNSSFKSKAGGRSTENKKNFSRENHNERSHTSRMNQSLYVPKSEAHKLDVSAEDSVDTTSAITSDSEADRSENPGEQQQASSAGLTKNRKASWHSHPIPSLPFEVQYSYSETPNAPVIRYRERPYSPFGPETMQRPWTGGPPLKKSKKNLPLFDSFNPPPKGKKGVKYVQDPGPYFKGKGPKPAKSREEILGEPLSTQEIAQLIDVCHNEDRQLNLGRDGLTHNMLDLVHCHWKRRRVIKVRCLGVPTIDMDNVCFHLEDKTGGKIVFRSGGVVYLFRGRNYNYRDRPQIPLMLWKPPAPVYPKLIKRAPEGLTVEEADRLRLLGKKVEPLCTLSKNGVYINLVDDVRAAFKIDKLVRINCRGLNPSDYKKIGAKLKDLVPCVLLSFDDEQILMWKGKEIPSADVGSLKGFDAVEALTEGSSLSHVASTSMNMEQLKAGVFANVSTAENNASLSGNVEVQLSSSSLEGFNDHASAPGSADGESDNAMVSIDGSQISSWSLDNGHTSHVTGDTPQISHSELSLENLMLTNLKASNEVDTPLHLASASQDERNLMFQNTRLQEENDTTLNEEKELSDAACIRKVEYKDYSLFTEVQEIDMTILQAASALESRSTSLANGNNVGVAEEGLIDSCVFVRVDDLWDQAITSGIAIQLDNVEMDIDIVARKAIELAEEAPAGEDYTRKLMRDLSPKTHKTYRPEHELQKHLKKIRKMRLEKKLSKRPFRKRTEDVPYVLPQDGLPNSGMPVDELARLLSIK